MLKGWDDWDWSGFNFNHIKNLSILENGHILCEIKNWPWYSNKNIPLGSQNQFSTRPTVPWTRHISNTDHKPTSCLLNRKLFSAIFVESVLFSYRLHVIWYYFQLSWKWSLTWCIKKVHQVIISISLCMILHQRICYYCRSFT